MGRALKTSYISKIYSWDYCSLKFRSYSTETFGVPGPDQPLFRCTVPGSVTSNAWDNATTHSVLDDCHEKADPGGNDGRKMKKGTNKGCEGSAWPAMRRRRSSRRRYAPAMSGFSFSPLIQYNRKNTAKA